ncbi:MAG TPA: hypothetical protein VIP28_06615 [Nocardioides sp.]
MIRALLALLARVLGECADCGTPAGLPHCNGCHNAPAYCVCEPVDLVPATCDDCGGPIGIVCCDLSDSLEYLEAVNR